MKTSLILFNCLLAFYGTCNNFQSQSNEKSKFKLTDVNVGLNSVYKTERIGWQKQTIIDSSSFSVLDSIVGFLKVNNNINLKITCYYQEVSPELEKHIALQRAKAIVDYFEQKGISKNRLFPIGGRPVDKPNSIDGAIKIKTTEFLVTK